MATDTNAFDAYLKKYLHRDILFRIVIWSVIAAATAAYAVRDTQFSGFDYFNKAAVLLLPLLNTFGAVSVFLVLVALYFKDAEHINPKQYGQDTKIGKVGGFFRRLAGDISLWVIGTVISLLTALTSAVILAMRSGSITARDCVAIAYMYGLFMVLLAVMSVLNVLARRAEPPLTASAHLKGALTNSKRVLLFYTSCSLFILGYAWLFGGS